MILFLTDGIDCTLIDAQPCKFDTENGQETDNNGPDLVLDLIEKKQQELENLGNVNKAKKLSDRAHIFTFSMTSDADDKIPKMISCEHNGSWSSIGGKSALCR